MKLVKGEPAPLKLVSFSREFFGSRRPCGQHRAGGAYEEIFRRAGGGSYGGANRNPLQFFAAAVRHRPMSACPPPRPVGPSSFLRVIRPVSSVNRTAETHAALSVWPFLREPSLCATFRLVAGAHGGAGRVDADERCAARADSQFEICAQRAR